MKEYRTTVLYFVIKSGKADQTEALNNQCLAEMSIAIASSQFHKSSAVWSTACAPAAKRTQQTADVMDTTNVKYMQI